MSTEGFALLLEKTESKCRLSGGTRLGDIDYAKFLVFQIVSQFCKIILADIVAGKEDSGILVILDKPGKRVAQRLDDRTGTEIAAADTGHHHYLALGAECVGHGLDAVEKLGCDAGWQMEPSQEVVTGASAFFQALLGGLYLWLIGLYSPCCEKLGGLGNV